MGHVVSVVTTRICRHILKAAIDKTELKCTRLLVQLHLQKQGVGQVWPLGPTFPTACFKSCAPHGIG